MEESSCKVGKGSTKKMELVHEEESGSTKDDEEGERKKEVEMENNARRGYEQ